MDAFGPVRMRSDVFGCNRMHFGASGSVSTLPEIFGFFRFFRTILVIFGRFWLMGAYFYCRFPCRGLTFIGANYWEVALAYVRMQIPKVSM